MLQTKRNKILLFVFIALTIINLAAVASVIYHLRKHHQMSDEMPANGEPMGDTLSSPPGPGFLMKELGFDDAQRKAFHESRIAFRDKARPLFMELRQQNNALADEIISDNPDTLKMNLISRQIGDNQVQLKLLTVGHMLEVKAIAKPGQQEKLGMFYRDLLSRDGRPPGKGMQHRYRHGRGDN
jgi:Spy/CpxP family protein refolding chaperone